jgi:hypothetical protein
MIGCRGRLQREGGVTHLIAEHFLDLSHLLRSVADRGGELRLRSGRGDESKMGTRDRLRSGSFDLMSQDDPRHQRQDDPPEIKVVTRDFR